MTLDDLVTSLRSERVPQRATLAAAVPMAHELQPRVIEIIAHLGQNVVLLQQDRRLACCGLYIMAAARCDGLWSDLVALCRASDECLDDLFPGQPVESIASLMLTAWDGDVDRLLHLVAYADMPANGKSALLGCLARLTIDGRVPRERTAELLERFERDGMIADDDWAWMAWQRSVVHLGLVELEPALQRVWSRWPENLFSADDRAEAQAALHHAAEHPHDPSAFDAAGIKQIDDPGEALSWLESEMLQYQADLETIEAEIDARGHDPARGVRLTLDESAWLAQLLVSDQVPDTTMSLQMLDGFLTALVIGPKAVPLSDSLPVVWGTDDGKGPDWYSPEQAAYFELLLDRQTKAIAARSAVDTVHVPAIFDDGSDDYAVEWADGFLTGIDLAADAWDPLYDDRRGNEIMLAIHTLADDPDVAEPQPTRKERAELVERLPALLQLIAAFWRDPNLRMPKREPIRAVKIGRNDPCPCGSGKKFKKCCGAAPPPVLH